MANFDRPTIIEKYANRVLYHTGTYALVTLDDLAAMVKRRKEFPRLRRQDGRRHHPIGAGADRL
jgi:polyhydroxyalkanoate synthesis regulator protein